MESVFLGYPSDIKGYFVLDLNSHELLITRNVTFQENIFTFKKLKNIAFKNSQDTLLPVCDIFYSHINKIKNSELSRQEIDQNKHSYTKSGEVHKTSEYLKNGYFLNTYNNTSHSTQHPLCNCVSIHRLSYKHKKLIEKISSTNEPTSFKDAVTVENWVTSMNKEMKALIVNKTWEITDLPGDRKAVGSK